MIDPDEILDAHGTDGQASQALVLADYFLERGQERLAASALDRARTLAPDDPFIASKRDALLDQLAVTEYGIHFRYIPAGTFLMGSDRGDPDERPVHAVRLGDYWLSDTPIPWATYCDLMGWSPPPLGTPEDMPEDRAARFLLHEENKIRLQYCETFTRQARHNWHAHAPGQEWIRGDGTRISSSEIFGPLARTRPERPMQYDVKPMVAVSWQDAALLGERISTNRVTYRLPTEAEWEKAARGALVAARYPWGDEEADPSKCDFGHFGDYSIAPPRAFASNGYGLLGMSGGVWEWTADVYDALAYRLARDEAAGRPSDPSSERVLRGGSWADCANAITVSFRMSRSSVGWRNADHRGDHWAPNIGFRLCRTEAPVSR